MALHNTEGELGFTGPNGAVEISEAERNISSTDPNNVVQRAISGSQFLDKGFLTTQELLESHDPAAFQKASAWAKERQASRVLRAKTGLSLTASSLNARQREVNIDKNNAWLEEAEEFNEITGGWSFADQIADLNSDERNNPIIMGQIDRRRKNRVAQIGLNKAEEGEAIREENSAYNAQAARDKAMVAALEAGNKLQNVMDSLEGEEDDFLGALNAAGFNDDSISLFVKFRDASPENEGKIRRLLMSGSEITEAQSLGLEITYGGKVLKGREWLNAAALELVEDPEKPLSIATRTLISAARQQAKDKMVAHEVSKTRRKKAMTEASVLIRLLGDMNKNNGLETIDKAIMTAKNMVDDMDAITVGSPEQILEAKELLSSASANLKNLMENRGKLQDKINSNTDDGASAREQLRGLLDGVFEGLGIDTSELERDAEEAAAEAAAEEAAEEAAAEAAAAKAAAEAAAAKAAAEEKKKADNVNPRQIINNPVFR